TRKASARFSRNASRNSSAADERTCAAHKGGLSSALGAAVSSQAAGDIAQRACAMKAAVLFHRQPARDFERHRESRKYEGLRKDTDSRGEAETATLLANGNANHEVRHASKFGVPIAGYGDQFRPLLLDRACGRAYLRVAAVGDGDDDVVGVYLAEAAVQSFGRVQK